MAEGATIALENLCPPGCTWWGIKAAKHIHKQIKLKPRLSPTTVRSNIELRQDFSSSQDLWKEAHVPPSPTWFGPLLT